MKVASSQWSGVSKSGFCCRLSSLLSALSFLGAMLLALCSPVEAQQPKKFFRIGVLFIGGRNQPHYRRQARLARSWISEGKKLPGVPLRGR